MKNDIEIWKALPWFPGVEISTLGKARTLDRVVSSESGTYFTEGKVLKQYENTCGYLLVSIPIDGRWTMKYVHWLAAQTFIENNGNLPEANHKDCDRKNNNVDNLEWCTHKENIAYRDKCGHTAKNNAPKLPVFAINLATLEASQFPSQSEAGRALGVLQQNINAVINGRRKHTGGYWFTNADNKALETTRDKLGDIVASKVEKLMKRKTNNIK